MLKIRNDFQTCVFSLFQIHIMPPRKTRNGVKSHAAKERKTRQLSPASSNIAQQPFGGKIKPGKKSAGRAQDGENLVIPDPVPVNVIKSMRLADNSYGLSVDDITTKQPDVFTLRVTFPTKTFLDLRAYSKRGVMLGKSNGTTYIKVTGQVPIEKDSEDIKNPAGQVPDLSNPELSNVLASIDLYSAEATWVLRDYLAKMWGDIEQVNIKGGLRDSKTIGGKVDYCLFPHTQYTNVYELDIRKLGSLPTKKKMEFLFSKSGNSEFIFALTMNCVEFKWQDGELTVHPYVNVNTMTWINVGQDGTISEEQEEQERVEQQIASITRVMRESAPSSGALAATSASVVVNEQQ